MTDKIERPSNVLTLADFRAKPGVSAKLPAAFEVKALENGDAEVFLYGEVGWDIVAKDVIEQLRAVDGEGKTVTFRINSPGGDVFDGYAIGNLIGQMKATTVAIVDGLAASMASFIAVSCDRCIMPANSMMMIHRPWSWSVGDYASHERAATVLSKLTDQMIAAYEAKQVRTLGDAVEGAEDMASMVGAETWLPAAEAVAVGLADEIVNEVKIAACVRADLADMFASAPEAVAELIVADAPDAASDQEEEPAAETVETAETVEAETFEETQAPVDPIVASLKSGADDAPVSTARPQAEEAKQRKATASWNVAIAGMNANFGKI